MALHNVDPHQPLSYQRTKAGLETKERERRVQDRQGAYSSSRHGMCPVE